MRTGQAAWVVGLASLLLILGLIIREEGLIALAVPLVVYLALGVVFRAQEPAVRVFRSVDRDTAYQGEELTVNLRVENLGRSLEFLELQDSVPPELELLQGSSYLVTQLQPKEAREFQYRLNLRVKGKYTLGPILMRSRDLMGFFVHEATVENSLTLVVSPRGEDVRKVKIGTRTTRPWLGQIPSRSPGLGTDFWSIRDYASGDEMRRINWKASSRLASLFTNEYEGEKSADFVIILDAREEAALGPVHDNAVEMGVRATISLASKLLENRNRVGLIVMRSVLDWVYPAFGRKQLPRIVEALVTVRPGGEWTLGHLPWILMRFFPPRCQLIIISPLVDRRAREAIAEMKARGFDAVVISPSMVDIEASLMEENERVRVAHSILRFERDVDIASLRRFAPVADWKPGEPLAVAMKEVETRRGRR